MTAVVVITYVGTGLGLLAAVALLVLAGIASGSGASGAPAAGGVLLLLALVIAGLSVFDGYMAYRIGQGSRGWRTAYLWLTGIGVVLDLVVDVIIKGQYSSLIGIALSVLCMLLLLAPSSRDWFDSQR